MKLVKFTMADLEQFTKVLKKLRAPVPPLHREKMVIDDVGIALVRLRNSNDARTNTYSMGFRAADIDYQFVVRPTLHGVPSITLNVIRKDTAKTGTYRFDSYNVLTDTVTTIKGEIAVPAPAAHDPPRAAGEEVPVDLLEQMLGQFKVT